MVLGYFEEDTSMTAGLAVPQVVLQYYSGVFSALHRTAASYQDISDHWFLHPV